jgi:hypothetical protein
VDFDLEKFFDRVNHYKLMGQVAKRVEDKRLLKLVRAFLNAGVMENGLVSPSVEGTPQQGEAHQPVARKPGRTAFASDEHNRSNRRIRTRTYGGVGGAVERSAPLSRSYDIV